MANELSSVIEMFQSFKKSCRSATLTISTWECKSTKVKLEVELDDATQSSASPSPTSTSPTVKGSRKILTVKKPAGYQLTFATLNLDFTSFSQTSSTFFIATTTLLLQLCREEVRPLPRLWKVCPSLPRPQCIAMVVTRPRWSRRWRLPCCLRV